MKTISNCIRQIPILLAAILAASPAFADGPGEGYYGHPMWSGGWGGLFMGWGMMAIFMIAVVAVILFLIRGIGGGGDNTRPSALDILDDRYARGEIDAAEYAERKKTILGKM